MPLIQKPITDTIGYTFETALADAQRYIEAYPLSSQPDEARIFMHAMLDYFKELGVSSVERDQILSAWTRGSLATWGRASDIAWKRGYEFGKSRTTPPF